MNLKDWAQRNTGVLLLAILFSLSMAMATHFIHHATDNASIQWIQNIVGQILAALLTLLVGGSNNRKQDTDPNDVKK